MQKWTFFHNSITLLSLFMIKNGVTHLINLSLNRHVLSFYRKMILGLQILILFNVCGGAFLP